MDLYEYSNLFNEARKDELNNLITLEIKNWLTENAGAIDRAISAHEILTEEIILSENTLMAVWKKLKYAMDRIRGMSPEDIEYRDTLDQLVNEYGFDLNWLKKLPKSAILNLSPREKEEMLKLYNEIQNRPIDLKVKDTKHYNYRSDRPNIKRPDKNDKWRKF